MRNHADPPPAYYEPPEAAPFPRCPICGEESDTFIHACEICGKTFYCPLPQEYVYKVGACTATGTKQIFFCSWTCKRKWEAAHWRVRNLDREVRGGKV